MTIDTICKIYGSGSRNALWPWGGIFGRVWSVVTPIGQLASTNPLALVLTAVAGTPAVGNPTSFTCPSVMLNDQSQSIVLTSDQRDVPLQWDVFPTDNAGTGSLFTTA